MFSCNTIVSNNDTSLLHYHLHAKNKSSQNNLSLLARRDVMGEIQQFAALKSNPENNHKIIIIEKEFHSRYKQFQDC